MISTFSSETLRIETNSPGSCSESFDTQVDFINPCATTAITQPTTLTTQTVYLDDLAPLVYDIVTEFQDSVSLVYGDFSGETFCGARSYAFSPTNIVTVGGT